MEKFKAAILDIDGTLTPQVSWTAFTQEMGGSVLDHLAIYKDHVDGKIELKEAKIKLLKIWQDTGKATRQHVERIFDSLPIKDETYTVIEWFKTHDYQVCLITGSLGIYAKSIAKRIGVEDYYANADLYFDDKGNLIDFSYTLDQAAVKLLHFKDYYQSHNLKPKDCVPIGDSNNDIELFRNTGNGILIKDNDKVTIELEESAWKIVDSLKAIIPILES